MSLPINKSEATDGAGRTANGWSLLRVAFLLGVGHVLIAIATCYLIVPRYVFYLAVTIIATLLMAKLGVVSSRAAIVLVSVVVVCSIVGDLVIFPATSVTLGYDYSSAVFFRPQPIIAFVGSIGIAFIVLSIFRTDYRDFLFRFSTLTSNFGRLVVALVLLFTPVYLTMRAAGGQHGYSIAQSRSEFSGNVGSPGNGGSGGGNPLPQESALSICASNLDSWVQYFQSNIYSGSNSFLLTLQNAGLLYGTGGIGGDIGEWIRERAIGQTNVTSTSECQSYLSRGIDVSWIYSAPLH
jgi:hypothetical protein